MKFKRAKQVPIHGKEEKRAFTAVLSVDLGGEVFSHTKCFGKEF